MSPLIDALVRGLQSAVDLETENGQLKLQVKLLTELLDTQAQLFTETPEQAAKTAAAMEIWRRERNERFKARFVVPNPGTESVGWVHVPDYGECMCPNCRPDVWTKS